MDPTGTYHGDSDLQLERINVYYNEATGKCRFCSLNVQKCVCVLYARTKYILNALATGRASALLTLPVCCSLHFRREICSSSSFGRFGARNDGFRTLWTIWTDF